MSTTFIKTGECARVKIAGAGEAAEVLNEALCGAQNVLGTLRWLGRDDRYDAQARASTHQLIYFMEGRGIITLEGKDYEVGKGAGVYLGPGETAALRPQGADGAKLFHLVVPEVADAA